jgi:DNA-binding response OmpR family regulator
VTTNPRALVADDDAAMLTSVAQALAQLGYDVVRAESGGDLMDQLADEGPFDLLVTDIAMPWLDGLNAIRSMRIAGLATPVIVMTALRDEEISDQVRALSPAILLRKPFDLDDLEAGVAALTS